MLLLDTNVLSEFRKINSNRGDLVVKSWAQRVSAQILFVSVITILELQIGTELMERRDKHQGAALRLYLNEAVASFSSRILPIDLAVTRRCASLHVPNPRSYRDSFIAATALVYGMTVVTRNIADFLPMKVPVLNPWET